MCLLLVLLAGSVEARREGACCFRELDGAKPAQRVLIVAPHIDDEAIAAGAYAADAVSSGAEVFIVYLTAGDHSRTIMTLNRLTFFASAGLTRKGKTRLAEGAEAAARLGLPRENVFLLGYPDRGLARMMHRPERTLRSASTGKRQVPYPAAVSPGAPHRLENVVADLAHVIGLVAPDVVIAPIARDRHPDHRAAANIVQQAITEIDATPMRLGYMIHSRGVPRRNGASARLLPENGEGEWVAYLISDETLARKRDVLRAYRTQRRSPYLSVLFTRSLQQEMFFLEAP